MNVNMNMKRWREKDGRLCHDGDCQFWNIQICTCGLIHHLNWPDNWPEEQKDDWFGKEWGMHERQLDRVPRPLPWVEPTKEELAERQKLLDKLFPGNDIVLDPEAEK